MFKFRNSEIFEFEKMWYILLLLVQVHCGFSALWPKGIIHYTINSKDYDVHSQDIIMSTFSEIQRELCIKFFNTPLNYTPTEDAKVLFISNPTKRKDCSMDNYDYTGNVVEMVIGYKCLNNEEISRAIVAMLRAGIKHYSSPVNSYDLKKKFEDLEKSKSPSRRSLLSPSDRNYINAYYHAECGALTLKQLFDTRRSESTSIMTPQNLEYYKDKLWPLGIVMYDFEEGLRASPLAFKIKQAMAAIELASCVVFQEMQGDDVLIPKSLLFFASEGVEAPQLGFVEDNQTISIVKMTEGAPGHTAHTLNLLFRALGIPMMSNRFDRDNYVTVNWNNVVRGMEHYLERGPGAAWVRDARFPYDFESVTHAPANFVCATCDHGETTLVPAQDHLWQKQMGMGHHTSLSQGDIELLKILYNRQCQDRFVKENDN